MNVTGAEILDAAQRYVGQTIDTSDALRVLNEAISRMGDVALCVQEYEVEATGGVWSSLPAEVTQVLTVRDADGNPYLDFETLPGLIRFGVDGTYRVLTRVVPTPMQAITDVPQVHQAYHPALVLYLAGWVKLKVDDDNSDGIRLLQEYQAEVQKTFATLRRRLGRKTFGWERAAIPG